MAAHTESISIAVSNSIGKIVMEFVIATKASTLCSSSSNFSFFQCKLGSS
jgi:hypothetical protein